MALAIKEAEDLIGDLGLSGEERELMEKILTDEKRQNVIKSRMHGKGEADRLMAEAKAERQRYEALEADANQKIDGWLKWHADQEQANTQFKTEAQAAREKELALRQYLNSQGIDPDMAVPAIANQPNNQPNGGGPSAFDWSKVMDDPKLKETFVPRDEAMKSLSDVMLLNDLQHKINLRHRKLFGDDIDDFSVLRSEAMAAKKDIVAYADEKFGFSKKEDENREKAIQDRIDKEVNEKLAARISAAGIPGANVAVTPDDSPIFKDDFADKGRVSESDADRRATERAMQFELANPNHATENPAF